MNHISTIEAASLPSLIDRASRALSNARTSAEVLEAREMASLAYDMAKRSARLSKAKQAHDELIGAVYRAQADALEIESQAKRRLADEYDDAQERGEIRKAGNPNSSGTEELPGPGNIGLSYKQIHEARLLRDAEQSDPGIVKRTLDDRIARGEEPNRAAIRDAVLHAAERGLRGGNGGRADKRNPNFTAPSEAERYMRAVSGACREILEEVGHHDPALLLTGFIDPSHRERSLNAIRACRDFLNRILENADAH